jgi:hypothetical protein
MSREELEVKQHKRAGKQEYQSNFNETKEDVESESDLISPEMREKLQKR